jgi:hypothetical protein
MSGRGFTRLVTPSGKQRRGRRWGSRAKPFRSERWQRTRGAERAEIERLREEGKTVVSIGCRNPDDGKVIEHKAGSDF